MIQVPKRLAIVGCGSSGLITLKCALDELKDWEIVAYEQSSSVTGCWGRPPSGFVSTSTKYTTQFACFPIFDACVQRDLTASTPDKLYPDFFCDGEYGDYLEKFADRFGLMPFIRLRTKVSNILRSAEGKWILQLGRVDAPKESHQTVATSLNPTNELADCQSVECDAVVVCTGLADTPKPIEAEVPILTRLDFGDSICNQKVVVIGGGESAVDVARRLAEPRLNNQVWLSVRSGMRVSPRYHPIRGVPSDYLRNRLLLSFDVGLRNVIGQKFVEFRMRCQRVLEWAFPARQQLRRSTQEETQRERNRWSWLLTQASKDSLFNVYHNKSDDFLDDVATGQITIVGGNSDSSYLRYFRFGSAEVMEIQPDLVVPSIGYQSKLSRLTNGRVQLRDFYWGIRHVHDEGLFVVGMTRPIIGNIPSISEMQAHYVVGQLAGKFEVPSDMMQRHHRNRHELERRFANLDSINVYPVEMFPYCDQLAREMGCFPSLRKIGSPIRFVRTMLSPATTMHYFSQRQQPSDTSPIYAPHLLTALLLMIKPMDWLLRWRRRWRSE